MIPLKKHPFSGTICADKDLKNISRKNLVSELGVIFLACSFDDVKATNL